MESVATGTCCSCLANSSPTKFKDAPLSTRVMAKRSSIRARKRRVPGEAHPATECSERQGSGAAVAVGKSLHAQFQAAFGDTRTDLKTRVSFKFSTSRGIYGTPAFIVNGFVLPGVGSPMDYNGWRKIIDPLVAAEKVEGDEYDSKNFERSVYLYK
ncbi:unnamed protein product [Linum tenue]|uniref:Thioredoxin-like fold domain-containing protein n=1 Tax=Linum tenue TaxID=586396 RepID=A0AAV0LPU4_9ROSI|nr:unnamed protein product [Linum tenue]